jgi:hypothetical protein
MKCSVVKNSGNLNNSVKRKIKKTRKHSKQQIQINKMLEFIDRKISVGESISPKKDIS